MVEEDLAINVGRNLTYADTFLTLGAGRVGMTVGSSAALRSVVDALEGGLAQTKVDLGVATQPGVPGGTGLPGVYGRELWILKSHPQEEQEASWKFIKWLMEPEQQAEWYAESGYLPANLKAFDLPTAGEIETKYPQMKTVAQLYLEDSSSPALLGPSLAPTWTSTTSSFAHSRRCLWATRTPSTPSTTPPRKPMRSSRSTTGALNSGATVRAQA